MPQVHSRDFGIVECAPESLISFPHGLPGFEAEREFVLMEPETLAPAVVLQSVATENLVFFAIPVSAADPNYQIGIGGDDLHLLGLDENRQPVLGAEVLCLAIVSAPEHGAITANLLAPIVVNIKTRVGVQAVRSDNVYSHCHRLGASTRATASANPGEPSCS